LAAAALGVMYQIVLTLTANGVRSGKLIAYREKQGRKATNTGRNDREATPSEVKAGARSFRP
jgi:hypothetical protein